MYLIWSYILFAVFCAMFVLFFFLVERHRFKREKRNVEEHTAKIVSDI